MLLDRITSYWQRSQLMTGKCKKYPHSSEWQSVSPHTPFSNSDTGRCGLGKALCTCTCFLVLCPCVFPESTALSDMWESASLPSLFSTRHAEFLSLANLSLSLLILSAFTAFCGSSVSDCCPKKHFYLLWAVSLPLLLKWPLHSWAAGFAELQFIHHFCDFINCSATFPHAASV